MEIIEESTPSCTLKCLRNVEHITNSVHSLKYGVNTIGRDLNNDIVLRNLNVSRTHCHLRVEKNGSEDIAFIKDLGTSNGTIVGNANLIQFKEYQLNNLDMIILATGNEGVVLQYIYKIDCSIPNLTHLYNNQINNKRKIVSVENLDLTAVKIPKLVINEPNIFKTVNENSNLLNELKKPSPNNLPQSDLYKPISSGITLKSAKDSEFSISSTETSKIVPVIETNNILTSVKIKTEPGILNNICNPGTYRSEEDSVIVIYSSDEENNENENDFKMSNINPQEQTNSNSTYIINPCPSTSRAVPVWSIQHRKNEVRSDDEDFIINVPTNSNCDDNINILMKLNDSDCDYNSKCPPIIEPLPMVPNKRKRQTKNVTENENIIKTRARSLKRITNKKQTEEITVDQNKQIIEERRLRLQQLTKNKCTSSTEKKVTSKNPSVNESSINEFRTTEKLERKTRISRFQNNNLSCLPSTSKVIDIDPNKLLTMEKSVTVNNQNITSSNIDYQILHQSSSCNFGSSPPKISLNLPYYETLSKICKWNAVWLREQKMYEEPPPLVESINKMKGHFENLCEYSSIVRPLLLYEMWSKISDSYNMTINQNPSLEKYIFEKSLKKDIPLLTFDIQSINKQYSTSSKALKSLKDPLWCLKCIEKNKKNIETKTGSKFSLKGYLCIATIQSKQFETDSLTQKPTKSRSIFFAYVNAARKIGYHTNTQLYIELIVTKKTGSIPIGTTIHLLDIFYLHSELRLFQALSIVPTSSLNNALITLQHHNYAINYSKANLKHYNINSLILNSNQKEAVKMAIGICLSKEPNVGLIIGPPGTGKTNVICNIVSILMSKLQINTNTKPKLLICAPSNEAVDALVRKIVEIKKDDFQFNIVRVGSGQKYDPHSPINEVLLDNLVKLRMINPLNEIGKQGQSDTLSIFTNKKDVETNILQNADVIVTTLNSCFSNRMENAFMSSTFKTLNGCHFTACIVDEAGQCVEPLNYVPMLLGIQKLILVGDDKQLQPVVKSKIAKDNGFGVSLFKRLKTWFENKCNTQTNFPITMLNIQYRMHSEICSFPSEYFYNGVLKTAPLVKTRKPLIFQPYLILEHESREDISGEINIGEAYMIVNLVEILIHSECKSLTIAVLTPYHRQREQINLLFENKKIPLNVNTIDSFQGGECDILLISTVRTNGIGFMDDVCRLNVALTRARQSLIICGNFMSLKGERVWYNLLENAKKRKLIKKVSKQGLGDSRTLLTLIKY